MHAGRKTLMSKRWGLKHDGRDFIVYGETREMAVELFSRELVKVFRLEAPPSIAYIETSVRELGLDEGMGRVLVDKNPARETRHAHVEPAPKASEVSTIPAPPEEVSKETLNGVAEVLEMMADGASKDCTLVGPLAETALERMKNRAAGK